MKPLIELYYNNQRLQRALGYQTSRQYKTQLERVIDIETDQTQSFAIAWYKAYHKPKLPQDGSQRRSDSLLANHASYLIIELKEAGCFMSKTANTASA